MITSKQRAYLRGLANSEVAILQVGKGGITEPLLATLSDALEARELIKLHVLENCDGAPKAILNELCAALGAEPVASIGRKIVLYRASSKEPVIVLP